MSATRDKTSAEARTQAGLTVAIAQPTFLPWLGWFDIADQVDLFVLFDDAAFSQRSWHQRNRIMTASGLQWVTVPVRTAGRFGQSIAETELADFGFVERLAAAVRVNYSRAPHFDRLYPEFYDRLRLGASSGRLVDVNAGLIDWLSAQLGVDTERVRSSELSVSGRRGERVAGICESVGAARLLVPPGAESYLLEDRSAFQDLDLDIVVHVYEHPMYAQCFGPFQPYASALDAVLNHGPAAGSIMRSGRREPRALGQRG